MLLIQVIRLDFFEVINKNHHHKLKCVKQAVCCMNEKKKTKRMDKMRAKNSSSNNKMTMNSIKDIYLDKCLLNEILLVINDDY